MSRCFRVLHRAPSLIRSLSAPLAWLAALVLLAAAPATAHVASFPIDADSISIDTSGGPGTEQFSFASSDSDGIPAATNPALAGSALLVRGEGVTPGRTPLLKLDKGAWSSAAGGGFEYDDPTGARGGVTNVLLQDGVLEITASGASWPFSPAGAQDAVWVHLQVEEEWYCAQFSDANATVATNQTGTYVATGAVSPGGCPEQVCGNGLREVGEECDDGNLETGDGCDPDCSVGACSNPSFDSTWEGIRSVIFESPAYGCTNGACHDAISPAGDLALDGSSDAYAALLGADGLGEASTANQLLERVLPSEPALSVLYLKLLKKSLEGQSPGYDGPAVGSSMPIANPAVIDDHLDALRLWIRGGAPEDLVVEETASLLGTCLPDADPLKAPVPAAPAPSEGFQLQQTARVLESLATGQGEDEICMSVYYDLRDVAPPGSRIPCPSEFTMRKACIAPGGGIPGGDCEEDSDCSGGRTCQVFKNAANPTSECVTFDSLELVQDGQSHHSIINVYTGSADHADPDWGQWTYKFEPDDPEALKNGLPCDPLALDTGLGFNRGCSTQPVESIACVGYGPPDLGQLSLITGQTGEEGNLPQVVLSQETYFKQDYQEGVYRVMPIQGVMVWNSHAFNLTQADSTLAQYLNLTYAQESERVHQSLDLFEAGYIFGQFIDPFAQKEVCATATFPAGSRITELSSHTHRHGVRWRTWGPPNTPCRPECPGLEEDPILVLLEEFGLCGDLSLPLCEGPREDEPIYFSTEYSDPVQMILDPPMELDSADEADRTLLYCSLYDNGFGPGSPPVKRFSGSAFPPDSFGLGPFIEVVGGPCYAGNLVCVDGDNDGTPCGTAAGGDDSLCTGGGVCDACPVHGGVTTEDEMLILVGAYHIVPIPEAGTFVASLAALGAVSALGGRRRRRRS